MRYRIHVTVTILVMATLLLSMVQPLVVSAMSPVKIPLGLVGPDTALGAKLEAIRLVEAMDYPDPDVTPPGRDQRKEYILLKLRASVDGTFRSDNFLEDGIAFEHDVRAAMWLRDMLADPNVALEVKDLATLALQKMVYADRLVTEKAIEATSVFGTDLPHAGQLAIQRAQQELAKGDTKVDKGMPVDAIRDYKKAWEYALEAIDLISAVKDPDGDTLIEWVELKLGTDPNVADSDADGLSDGEEFSQIGTDPTKADSDGDGVLDGMQDIDGDGLTNQEEVTLGTNALRADTDRDGLDDGFEVNVFGSDPRKQDTDDDGLTDDSEYRLGTDPRNPDTDGNGILDGFETYTSTAAGSDGTVVVELTGVGDVARTTTIRGLPDDVHFQVLPGQMSPAVDIKAEDPFENARVKMRFDPAQVPNGDYEGLRILYYDETARAFLGTNNYGVDIDGGYAWTDTSHFTVFVLFYIPNWQTAWTHPMDPGRPGEDPKLLDVMLILDSSGSMSWNDPQGLRKVAAKEFIDALLDGDQVGVVDFDSSARLYQGLTTNHAAAKTAVDRIDSSGGTNIGAGVSLAHQEILAHGDPEHLPVEILLTDGQGSYNHSLTTQAVNAGIVIYTIGMGPAVDQALLRSIADATGGMYFPVASADQLPDVFKRIPGGGGEDSDGDGLPDQLEINGIRIGNGTIIYTDPNLWDTDGDGLSDGEELGSLLEAPWGNYFQSPSNPLSADSDGDGLLDVEEVDLGTNPYDADSDGDGLGDYLEVNWEFDPLNPNPDGDERNDLEEWNKESDPWHYDPNRWEQSLHAVAGFILGEFGENFANIGWIDHDTIRSMTYLAGWLASNVVSLGIGDLRDVVASLLRLDLLDTLLNAVGFIPVLGDGLDAAKDVAKWLGWSEDLAIPLTRWIAVNFADNPDALKAVLKVVGHTDELGQVLSKDELVYLARYRNDFKVVDDLVAQGVRIGRQGLDSAAWARVANRLANNELWDVAKLADPRTLAEARAVEAAVEALGSGHDILYVGRNLPLEMADGTAKYLSQGPDIVAVNRATGRTVVVEVKGAIDDAVLTGSRLQSKVGNTRYVQTSYDWLATNSGRYLDTLEDAADPQLQAAATRLADIVDNRAPYESVIVGYGPGQGSRFGKIDAALSTLHDDAAQVKMILIDP